MGTDILEPLDSYKMMLKDKHHDNTVKYFDDLVKESKVDIEENKRIVKRYNDAKAQLDKVTSKKNGFVTLKVFMFIFGFAGIGIGILMMILGGNGTISAGLGIGLGIGLIAIGILLFVLYFVKLKKVIKNLKDVIKKMEEKCQKILDEAWANMAPLNALYDWNIPATITNKDTDLIKLDKYFDPAKFEYLKNKFGFDDMNEKTVSTVTVQSGSILGNPFLICKDLNQDWKNVTYEGTLVIHWTETVHTKEGTRIVHRTQTLVATVTKPAPDYNYDTYLVYGNEAAPKLKFTRHPSSGANLDDKKLDKFVEKEAKSLDKLEKKALMDGNPDTNFQKLGNDEFEALFGATDRNDELEFRLLFTPLAQKNLIKLIRSKEPYGDDFYITKDKKLNYVQSLHSQSFNYRANPEIFMDYDFERAKKNFIDYNDNFFKSFYFDLAPLISIPLYQQTKTREFIYNEGFNKNTTSYEDEVLANQFDSRLFAHPESRTRNILKANFVSKVGNLDNITITAYGFKTVKHTDLIPTMGGDGRMHSVPVEWIEYLPVSKETPFVATEKETTRNGFNNLINTPQFKAIVSKLGAYHFERGLFAYVGVRATEKDVLNLNKAFGVAEKDTLKETLAKVDAAVKKGEEAEKKLQTNDGSNDKESKE